MKQLHLGTLRDLMPMQLPVLMGGDDGLPRPPTARGRRGARLLSVRELFESFPCHDHVGVGARLRMIAGVRFVSIKIVVDREQGGATRTVHVLVPSKNELEFGLMLAQSCSSPACLEYVGYDVARWAFFEANAVLDPDRGWRRLRAAKAYFAGGRGALLEPPKDDKRLRRELVPILSHAARFYLRPSDLAKLSKVERAWRFDLARKYVAQMLGSEFPFVDRYPSVKEVDEILRIASGSLAKKPGASIYDAAAKLAWRMGAARVDGETVRTDPETPKLSKSDKEVGLWGENRGKDPTDAPSQRRVTKLHASRKKQQEPSPRTKPPATPRARHRSGR